VEQLKFIDAIDLNLAITRRYGRVAPGERVVERVPHNYGENGSVLAALGVEGISASMTVAGAGPLFRRSFFAIPMRIRSYPRNESGFVKSAFRQTQDRLSRAFLACGQAVSVHFEKDHTDDEADPFVTVNKWMVADDPGGVGCRQFNHVWLVSVCMQLARSRHGRCEQARIAHSWRAAI
jgi:hypothetical protein